MAPTLVLVHGAWHGSWCWTPLLSELDGVDVRSVDLPSVGDAAAGLREDAAVLRAAVAAVDGPVVVCAHSYGGAVASEALAGLGNVAHIVYLCAFVLGPGESLFKAIGGEPRSWWNVRDDGLVTVRDPESVFYHDVPESVAQDALGRIRPQSLAGFTGELTAAAWESTPTTYLVCANDRAIPPVAQRRMAARTGGTVHELETSHSPFLARPDLVADLLRAALGR